MGNTKHMSLAITQMYHPLACLRVEEELLKTAVCQGC